VGEDLVFAGADGADARGVPTAYGSATVLWMTDEAHGRDRSSTAPRRDETRAQIVARIAAEQDGLHPSPEYSRVARRRLWVLGVTILPVSLVVAWLLGLALDWSVLLWVGCGLGISLGAFYIAYVVLAERDDGKIQRELDGARAARADG